MALGYQYTFHVPPAAIYGPTVAPVSKWPAYLRQFVYRNVMRRV